MDARDRAYLNARRMNRARALVRTGVAELDRQQRMQLFLELYEEAEAETTTVQRRTATIMGPNGPVTIQMGMLATPSPVGVVVPDGGPYPTQEPAAGSLRADILRILSESNRPLRTAEVTERLAVIRPDVKLPSVASAIWHFVRTGRVHKATDRKRDYYAVDPKVLGLLADAEATPSEEAPDGSTRIGIGGEPM